MGPSPFTEHERRHFMLEANTDSLASEPLEESASEKNSLIESYFSAVSVIDISTHLVLIEDRQADYFTSSRERKWLICNVEALQLRISIVTSLQQYVWPSLSEDSVGARADLTCSMQLNILSKDSNLLSKACYKILPST